MIQLQPFLNTLIKTIAYLMHHLACHYGQTKLTTFWGVLAKKKNTQKQLKMIASLGRKAFENLKLENYICDINKNFQVCIPH